MINIAGLSKNYGNHTVLDNINLAISRGEIHGLLGISGAGKSTILRCINGLEAYSKGSLQVNGIEISTLQGYALQQLRKNIGMIFQDFALLERKTVLENVLLPMQCWKIPRAKQHQKAKELLALVGIADKMAHRPQALSGGQKQRVAIARALTLEPEILLCDEATSALDPMTTESVLDLLKSINRSLGITMVLVTHQMAVVKQVCDRVSIIEHGKIALTDSVEAVFIQEPPALKRLTGSPAVHIPPGMCGIKISLDPTQMATPVFADLAMQMGLRFTMLHAHTDHCPQGTIGHFFIAVDNGDQPEIIRYLQQQSLPFTLLAADPHHLQH